MVSVKGYTTVPFPTEADTKHALNMSFSPFLSEKHKLMN